MQENTTFKFIQFLLFSFIVVNLFILDLKIFSGNAIAPLSSSVNNPTSTQSFKNLPVQTGVLPTTNSLSCPSSCIELISDATKSGDRTGSFETAAYSQQPSAKPVSREYFIPLGTGSTTKSDWEDIIGTETIINSQTYKTIKEVLLTYALRNPTQNGKVGVRLYNVTDKYVVYGSEAEMNGPASQTINTGSFAFPDGNKLYRIQMRSTLSYPAYLDNARLKIISE